MHLYHAVLKIEVKREVVPFLRSDHILLAYCMSWWSHLAGFIHKWHVMPFNKDLLHTGRSGASLSNAMMSNSNFCFYGSTFRYLKGRLTMDSALTMIRDRVLPVTWYISWHNWLFSIMHSDFLHVCIVSCNCCMLIKCLHWGLWPICRSNYSISSVNTNA